MLTQPLHVVFCYAPQDEDLCTALEEHLSLLSRQGYITSWSSRKFDRGAERRGEGAPAIDRADLILLLVSAHFLASDQLYEVELRRALQRPDAVIGVLLRPCDWRHGDLAELEMHPRGPGGEVVPVTSWESVDLAFTRVAEKIRERAQLRVGVLSQNPPPAHPAPAPQG